jgi:hypothetical protein
MKSIHHDPTTIVTKNMYTFFKSTCAVNESCFLFVSASIVIRGILFMS